MIMNKERQLYKEAVCGILPDKDDIRKKVLRQGEESSAPAKSLRWVVPVVATIAALAVICVSVPSVRAAIAQWFSINCSIQNYLAQPEEARPSTPELEAIIAQTMPEETAIPNSIEIASIAPEWQQWANSLNPSIGDIFFDGKELMVSFDMGGGAAELVMGGSGDASPYKTNISMNNPGYIILNGEKYAHSVNSDLAEYEYIGYMQYLHDDGSISEEDRRTIEEDDSVLFTATVDLTHSKYNAVIKAEDLPEEDREEYLESIKKLQEFDPDYVPDEIKAGGDKLTGTQQVEIHIPLTATDFSTPSMVEDDGVSYQSEVIGMVKLCFSFDPTAGYANMQSYAINQTVQFQGEGTYAWSDWDSDPEYVTFVNKTVDMAGVTMTAKRMDCYASGAELYVSITCPDSWDEHDKQCFLHSLIPHVKGDGIELQTSGEQYGLQEDGEDLGMCIYLDMLESELDAIDMYEIELILSQFSGYDDVPYTEGEPIKIKKSDADGWQEESDILEECVLQFSID